MRQTNILIAAFKPGTSPPPVRMPTRRDMALLMVRRRLQRPVRERPGIIFRVWPLRLTSQGQWQEQAKVRQVILQRLPDGLLDHLPEVVHGHLFHRDCHWILLYIPPTATRRSMRSTTRFEYPHSLSYQAT